MCDAVTARCRRCVSRTILRGRRRFQVALALVLVIVICLHAYVSVLSVKRLPDESSGKSVPLYDGKELESGIFKTGPPRLCPEFPLDLSKSITSSVKTKKEY